MSISINNDNDLRRVSEYIRSIDKGFIDEIDPLYYLPGFRCVIRLCISNGDKFVDFDQSMEFRNIKPFKIKWRLSNYLFLDIAKEFKFVEHSRNKNCTCFTRSTHFTIEDENELIEKLLNVNGNYMGNVYGLK